LALASTLALAVDVGTGLFERFAVVAIVVEGRDKVRRGRERSGARTGSARLLATEAEGYMDGDYGG
jgi:hypothetical protein